MTMTVIPKPVVCLVRKHNPAQAPQRLPHNQAGLAARDSSRKLPENPAAIAQNDAE